MRVTFLAILLRIKKGSFSSTPATLRSLRCFPTLVQMLSKRVRDAYYIGITGISITRARHLNDLKVAGVDKIAMKSLLFLLFRAVWRVLFQANNLYTMQIKHLISGFTYQYSTYGSNRLIASGVKSLERRRSCRLLSGPCRRR